MLHRLPEQHECLFDHLGRGRQEAVLKMVKLDRKVGRSCQRIGEECSWASSHSEEPPCSDCVLALAGFIFSLSHFFFFSRNPPLPPPHFYLCLDYFPLPLTWSYPCCWRAFGKNPYPGTMEQWTAKEVHILLPFCKLLTWYVRGREEQINEQKEEMLFNNDSCSARKPV